jgi:ketosteroid isomerase-like protein
MLRGSRFVALMIAGLLPLAVSAYPQNKQKKEKNVTIPMPPMPIPEQIEHDIGEMLGAWQVGDVEALHKYYADNATWVAGTDAPPVKGWQNYVAGYEKQRSQIMTGQLIRKNTNIFHYGDVAWACYQWQFDYIVDGKSAFARGQTTLVLVKTGERWLIVHNHTSEICPQMAQQAAATGRPRN